MFHDRRLFSMDFQHNIIDVSGSYNRRFDEMELEICHAIDVHRLVMNINKSTQQFN